MRLIRCLILVGFWFFLTLPILGKTWANRPYRDRDASCGSARLLTLSKVTLPSAELTSANLTLKSLENEPDQGNVNNYVYSRSSSLFSQSEVVTRPVTRSLTRLAAPRETHNPCPRTFRTKTRSHWSTSTVPSEAMDHSISKTSPPKTRDALDHGSSSIYHTSQSVSLVTDTNSNSSVPRVITRSSTRIHNVVSSSNKSNNNEESVSPASRTNFAKLDKPLPKSSSVFRSVVASKSTPFK